jgi:hypothetical protein
MFSPHSISLGLLLGVMLPIIVIISFPFPWLVPALLAYGWIDSKINRPA